MRYLAVKNWQKYQHYKCRRPPWIKLHEALLDDFSFMSMPDSQRLALVLLWLLAAKCENRIPFEMKWISSKTGGIKQETISRLLADGWIYECSDASTMLADSKHDDSITLPSRASAPSREEEKEEEASSSHSSKKKLKRSLTRLVPSQDALNLADLHWKVLEHLKSTVCATEDRLKWTQRQAESWNDMLKHGVTITDAVKFFEFVKSDQGAFWRDKISSAKNLWVLKDGRRKIHTILDQAGRVNGKPGQRESFRDRGVFSNPEDDAFYAAHLGDPNAVDDQGAIDDYR